MWYPNHPGSKGSDGVCRVALRTPPLRRCASCNLIPEHEHYTPFYAQQFKGAKRHHSESRWISDSVRTLSQKYINVGIQEIQESKMLNFDSPKIPPSDNVLDFFRRPYSSWLKLFFLRLSISYRVACALQNTTPPARPPTRRGTWPMSRAGPRTLLLLNAYLCHSPKDCPKDSFSPSLCNHIKIQSS